jgi:hypothetical protein
LTKKFKWIFERNRWIRHEPSRWSCCSNSFSAGQQGLVSVIHFSYVKFRTCTSYTSWQNEIITVSLGYFWEFWSYVAHIDKAACHRQECRSRPLVDGPDEACPQRPVRRRQNLGRAVSLTDIAIHYDLTMDGNFSAVTH